MEAVTRDELRAAFPHGAIVAQDGPAANYSIVDLELFSEDGETVILGWAYPNKNMRFVLKSVEKKSDGDWILATTVRRYRFSPLTKEDGQRLQNMMKDA